MDLFFCASNCLGENDYLNCGGYLGAAYNTSFVIELFMVTCCFDAESKDVVVWLFLYCSKKEVKVDPLSLISYGFYSYYYFD